MRGMLPLGVCITLLAATAAGAAHLGVVQEHPDHVRLVCPAVAPWPSLDKSGRRAAGPPVLPGAAPTWEIGRPQVPVYRTCIAVPRGAEVTLTVSCAAQRPVRLRRELAPMQPLPPTTGWGNVRKLVRDEAVYASNDPYPAARARIVSRGMLRDLDVVTVEVAPVQYLPESRTLLLAEGLEVLVECAGGGPLASQPLEHHQLSMYRALVANAAVVEAITSAEAAAAAEAGATAPPPGPLPQSDTGADILIITHDTFASELVPLVTYREAQGYVVEVVAVNADIYTPAGATTDQEKVDALYDYIATAYATWSPQPSFVLLVGDKAEIVPHEFTGTYGDIGYTDHYFACVSPPVPPTSGGDWYADLAIGRFSASNTTDVANQITKTLFYEQNPQARTGVGGASGEIGGDFENCEDCKIELLMEAGGLFCQTNYNGLDGSDEYTFVSAINGAIDKTTPKDFAPGVGIITVDTHGNSSVWGGLLSISSVNDYSMKNRHYFPLAFISACMCGQMEVEDCIQEKLQTIQGGTVGNSGSATLACGGTSDQLLNIAVQGLLGVDPPYHPTLFEYMISPDIGYVPIVGQAMMIARNEYLTYFGDPNGWNVKECMMQYNLFGDPALMTDFLAPPKMTSVGRDGSAVSLEWTPIFPRYTVQYRDSIDGPWLPVPGTTWPIKASTWTGDDITALTVRFYRIIGNAAD